MNEQKFLDECRKIVCEFEKVHTKHKLLYKTDVIIHLIGQTETKLFTECSIDGFRIYKIAYDNLLNRYEVKIYTLTDSAILYT